MKIQHETARAGGAREDGAVTLIRTSEGAAIQASRAWGPDATRRAISELLGPVYERRTDLGSARTARR